MKKGIPAFMLYMILGYFATKVSMSIGYLDPLLDHLAQYIGVFQAASMTTAIYFLIGVSAMVAVRLISVALDSISEGKGAPREEMVYPPVSDLTFERQFIFVLRVSFSRRVPNR